MDFQEGQILYFDKPLRWTSFNLVAKVRWQLCHRLGLKKLKVGHAGTLDPLATGVLIVCTGRATKRIDELQAGTKEYVATLQLGATTPCFDLEKPIDKTYPTDHITLELIEEILHRADTTCLLGMQSRRPPCLQTGTQGGGSGTETQSSRHRRDGTREVRCRTDATDLAHRMQQRNIHPSIGTRHWSGSQQWSPSHRSASHAHRRRSRRTMYAD